MFEVFAGSDFSSMSTDLFDFNLGNSYPGIMDVNYDIFGNLVPGSGGQVNSDLEFYNNFVENVNALNALGEGAVLAQLLAYLSDPEAHTLDEWMSIFQAADNQPFSRLVGLEVGTDENDNFVWGGELVYQ
jgi:hypothetical protein